MKTPLLLPRITHRLAWASAMALACHAALAAIGNTPAAAAPETLGTLLFTPAQREQIIRARQPQTQTGEQEATTSVSHLQGVVRRDGGNSTVWINGKALPQGQAQTPTLQGVDALVAGRRLRVGEAIDTLSGVRSDVVVPGTVTVTKPPSK
jgi:hypothetical protein